jgi:hypothetical protein
MPTAREQIFLDLDARLSAIVGVAEYKRMPTGDPARFPAVHLFDSGQRPAEGEAQTSTWDLRIQVEGYVQGGASPHADMSELHADVVKAVMGEPFLAGVQTVEEDELAIDLAELGNKKRIGFIQIFEIQFATLRGDPTQFA